MPVLKRRPLIDKKTGEQKTNKKGDGLTYGVSDANQHGIEVPEAIFDQLYNSLKTNQFEKSAPITDIATEKIYIMEEGNSQNNDPEHGKHIGPIIKQITEDEARAEKPNEKATLENVMARLRVLETDGKLKDEKISYLEKRNKPQERADDTYDLEKAMKDFFGLDGRSHVKFIEDGKCDDLIGLLVEHPDATEPTKNAAKARQDALAKVTG